MKYEVALIPPCVEIDFCSRQLRDSSLRNGTVAALILMRGRRSWWAAWTMPRNPASVRVPCWHKHQWPIFNEKSFHAREHSSTRNKSNDGCLHFPSLTEMNYSHPVSVIKHIVYLSRDQPEWPLPSVLSLVNSDTHIHRWRSIRCSRRVIASIISGAQETKTIDWKVLKNAIFLPKCDIQSLTSVRAMIVMISNNLHSDSIIPDLAHPQKWTARHGSHSSWDAQSMLVDSTDQRIHTSHVYTVAMVS